TIDEYLEERHPETPLMPSDDALLAGPGLDLHPACRDNAGPSRPGNRSMEKPGWFVRALATPFEDRSVTVDGVPIHYLYWTDKGNDKPGLLFVHGNGAHAHWWTFLAP